MAEAVISENEVSINGVRYPMLGSVQRGLSSNYPPKLVTGDYTKDSSPILSSLVLLDHRGGIGLDIMEGQGDTDRSNLSFLDTRFKGYLMMPQAFDGPLGGEPSGITAFAAFCTFKGEVYVYINATSAGIYKYATVGDTWGTRIQATGVCTDAVAGRVGGSDCIVYCDGSNFYYSTDGAAWTTDTTNASFLAIWDDKLWGIDTTGQLWYVTALGGTVVNDAKLPVPLSATLKGLFVGLDASGEDIIYAVTTEGLYAHDFDNGRFVKTRIETAGVATVANAASGFIANVWRNSIYYSSGNSVFKYDPGTGLVTNVGWDRDGNNTSLDGYQITHLIPSYTELLALAHKSASDAYLMGYSGQGWRILAYLATNPGVALHVSGAYGAYRAWFATDVPNSYYLNLPTDFTNPIFNGTPDFSFATADHHIWPVFTADNPAVDKVAVRLIASTVNCTEATNGITISWRLNFATGSWTTVKNITSDGADSITSIPLPNSTTPTGTLFKALQLRVDMPTTSATAPPYLRSLTLEYYKKLDPKYQFQVTLDMTKDYKNNTVKGMRAALLTAMETATLVEFTYHDPSSNSDATFYVQVRLQVSTEFSGNDERGTTQLLLVEV